MNSLTTIQLTPPIINYEHIKERIICIRAHRERIFRVDHELTNGKHIFHNYGQGGAGWTFLFGCVDQSIEQFKQLMIMHPELKKQEMTVVGAGCYGLLTALELFRLGYNVRIIAKEINDLSSSKAAGFFFPRPRRTSTEQERKIFEEYGMHSYAAYLDIIKGKHPYITAGPKIMPAYYGLDVDPGFAPYIQKGLVERPNKVAISFGNGKQYEVMHYRIVFINPAIIFAQLQQFVKDYGIAVVQQEVHTFEEISAQIIFNCTGLGSKQLTSDKSIIPVQGHLITLKNQSSLAELQYMINVKVGGFNERGIPRNDLIYYAPKDEGILGITFLRGTDSLTSNYHEFDRLINRCHTFFS